MSHFVPAILGFGLGGVAAAIVTGASFFISNNILPAQGTLWAVTRVAGEITGFFLAGGIAARFLRMPRNERIAFETAFVIPAIVVPDTLDLANQLAPYNPLLFIAIVAVSFGIGGTIGILHTGRGLLVTIAGSLAFGIAGALGAGLILLVPELAQEGGLGPVKLLLGVVVPFAVGGAIYAAVLEWAE